MADIEQNTGEDAGSAPPARDLPEPPTRATLAEWQALAAKEVKGADLGSRDRTLVLDLNFAYNPSCAYDPAWACPLAQPGNTLDVPVPVGERG